MPLLILDDWLVITLDIVLWLVIHLVIAKFSNEIPLSFFYRHPHLFAIKNPERNGWILERFFLIKKWKKYLPDGAKIFKDGFEKKSLKATSIEYLERFIVESKRAELSHYLQMLPVPIFFLFNLWWVGWIMVGYALLVNMPCVLAQRYNRPRFEKVLELQKSRQHAA